MALYKNIGDEAYNTDTGGDDDVSYTPEEAGSDRPEERSDAQRIMDGDLEIDDGGDGIFVDPYAVYGKKEEEEEETGEEPEEEEVEEKEVKKLNEEDETGDEEPEKEVKKKTGEEDPEVIRLAKQYSQKRINKISREKFELRDENEELRKKIRELEGKSREADFIKRQAEHSTKKPKYDDFDNDADFYEALGRWSARDEIYAHEASQPVIDEEPITEDQERQTFERIRDKILTEGGDKYPDFAERVLKTDGSIVITPEMVMAAGDSDNAADIFYYLGQNPEESHRIAQLRGSQIAREMGIIESKFLGKEEVVEEKPVAKSEPKPKPLNKPASPPPPVKPIGGGGRQPVDLDKADIGSYFEARGFDRTGMKKRTNT